MEARIITDTPANTTDFVAAVATPKEEVGTEAPTMTLEDLILGDIPDEFAEQDFYPSDRFIRAKCPVRIRALSRREVIDARKKNKNKKGDVNIDGLEETICLLGLVSPCMNDVQLLEKSNCATPIELLYKSFRLGGEISSIYAEILALSGFTTTLDGDITAIKN
ncbi:MAG: hypothetical protein LBQ80_04185 [Clostridium sp.]|jgi:hypothetical protein|nr:hypothetical protein [Clostridium sp.]